VAFPILIDSNDQGTKGVTIATASGGRQRTPMDGLPQARRAVALAVSVSTWLQDEEAWPEVVSYALTVGRRSS
jgi:hypothetical protein